MRIPLDALRTAVECAEEVERAATGLGKHISSRIDLTDELSEFPLFLVFADGKWSVEVVGVEA